jgi:hypothetical protein
MKDKAFAGMFGTGKPKPMTWTSMGLFACRDSASILASFSLPPVISQKMQVYCRGSSIGNPRTADTIAQLLTPVSMQILSTPLHLLGLDIYNRPNVSIGLGGNKVSIMIYSEIVHSIFLSSLQVYRSQQ